MRVFAFIAVAVSVLAGAASAQAPADAPYDQTMNVVYGETDGIGLVMDVFVPKGAKNGLGIVDVASGAWHSDRGKIEDHRKGQIYDIHCGRGYTVFAVRPGSVSIFTGEDMLAHVKLGIRYVKAHAGDYGVDPDRLGITGASAGGHLATLAVVTAEEGKADASDPLERLGTQVKAAAVFFPPTDFLDWGGKPLDISMREGLFFRCGQEGHTPEEIAEASRKLSPARLVTGPLPPFLFIHGDADPLVPLQQSQKMVEVIKAAGGSAELIVKAGGAHPWPTIHEEVKVMADWFDRQLSAAPPAP